MNKTLLAALPIVLLLLVAAAPPFNPIGPVNRGGTGSGSIIASGLTNNSKLTNVTIYTDAGDVVGIFSNATAQIGYLADPPVVGIYGSVINAQGAIIPTAEDTYDLGSASVRWKDLYVSSTYIRELAYISGALVRPFQKTGDGTMVLTSNAFTIATNASFTIDFSGTATHGQRVLLSVSNHNLTADINITNAGDGIYVEAARAFTNILTVASNSIATFEFVFNTNFIGGGRWSCKGDEGFRYAVFPGMGVLPLTNGPNGTVTWNMQTGVWSTNGHLTTISNTPATNNILDIVIPGGVMNTNSTLEIYYEGRYHNASSSASPTNVIQISGTNVLTWTNSVLSLNNANQWRPIETWITIRNMDSLNLQTLSVKQLIGGAGATFPDNGLLAVGTTFSSVIMRQVQFAIGTGTNNPLVLQLALTNGTASAVIYPATVTVKRNL